MSLPEPKPGLVIRYAYLWRNEAVAGRDEGIKDRPCAVILTTKRKDDEIIVTVAPITHARPNDIRAAIPLTSETQHRLGLDDDPAWVVVDEVNRFVWPGPDLRPVKSSNNDRWAYGYLPYTFTKKVQQSIADLYRKHKLKQVPR